MGKPETQEVAKGHWVLKQDHEDVKMITEAMKKAIFPFKGIESFYDVGAITRDPVLFQKAIDLFVQRYSGTDITAVAGFDARGFIFGPPLALALKVPFHMLRKGGKLPGPLQTASYNLEYGNDSLCIQEGSLKESDKVVLIDDLIATGGTLSAGAFLVEKIGAQVLECACILELPQLNGVKNFHEKDFNGKTFPHVPVFTMVHLFE